MKRYTNLLLVCFALVLFAGCAKTQYVHVGANWNAVHNLKESEKGFRVVVEGPVVANLGDDLSFTVTSEKSGRLWVVRVDPNDALGMLFPNQLSGTNWIDAGKIVHLPGKNAQYAIATEKPKGVSTIAFIVTDPDTDLSAVLTGQQASMEKALSIVRTMPSWGISHLVVDVK